MTNDDRSRLAAVAHTLPRPARTGRLVTPDTLLRGHRRRVARHWTHPPRRPGRAATAVVIRRLVIEMATDNPTRGYVEYLRLSRERRGSNRSRLSWLDDGLTIDGRSLAFVGMQFPALCPESAIVLHLQATD